MKKYLITTVMIASLWGCVKDEDVTLQNGIEQNKLPTKGYIISPDSVRKIALSAPDFFSNSPKTKSIVSLKRLQPINDLYISTKSSGETVDELNNIYVAEYTGGKGFSIISADNRMEQVLAYSDNGSFEDAKKNPGVNIFLGNLPAYTKNEISKYELSQEELLGTSSLSLLMDSFDPGFEYPVDREITLSAIRQFHGPLLAVRWGIYAPFSNLIGSSCGSTVTAILQLMSHYGHPTTGQYATSFNPPAFESFDLNWSIYRGYIFAPMIESDPQAVNALSKMAKTVWNSVTDQGSVMSASLSRAIIALNHYGYNHGNVIGYTKNGIINDILNNKVSIVGGYAGKEWYGYLTDGSVWLVDGYSAIEKRVQIERTWYDGYGNIIRTEQPIIETTNYSYWLHCNWGFDGRSDGYFYEGVFDMANPAQSDNLFTSESNAHFKYQVEQINDIMPK